MYVSSIVPTIQQLKLDFFGHDQVVLHERDIRRQSPPFGFLRTYAALRTDFLNRLNEVVGEAEIEIISTVIHKDRLTQKYATPWNPYDIALLFCMEKVMERLIALGQAGRLQHGGQRVDDVPAVARVRRQARVEHRHDPPVLRRRRICTPSSMSRRRCCWVV